MNERLSRRKLLNIGIFGFGTIAGTVVGIPIISYLLSPLLNPAKNAWRDVGAIDDFKVGDTVEVTLEEPSPLPWAGATAQTSAWLRRTGDRDFTAFAVNCTHLGCPVNWLQEAELFLCPCHGGIYDANGDVAGGPPPRALWQHQTRVVNGRVQVLTRGLQVA
ncbi:MAG: ubiquinol-cytochrome c reductase iron-sulfur subunit [Thermomicrobiales bacterium]